MDLNDYLAPFRKWWWLILSAMFVSGLTTFIVTSNQAPIYESQVTLMIGRAISDPNPSNTEFVLGQLLAATYADIANREPVRRATMDALGLDDWLPDYVVQTVPNTQLLEIIVTDTNKERVQAVANELANQLILQSPTSSLEDQKRQDFINSQLDEYEIQIQETRADIQQAQTDLVNEVNARAIQDLQNKITALESKLSTLQSNYAGLLASTEAGALNTLTIIEPARLPNKPVGPNKPLATVTAIGIGFLLSASLAFLLEYFDNSIKSPEDVERFTKLPTLASVYQMEKKGDDNRPVTIREPRSLISEEYRKLRTGIQFAGIDQNGGSVVLVTSAIPKEGKSTTTANLAVVLAQAGKTVVVIDTDLRRPSQHKAFQINNRRGLTDLLLQFTGSAGQEELDELLSTYGQTIPQVNGLIVLTSGFIPPNPSELASSTKLHALIKRLAEHFDYVLLDSPPIHLVTDATVLSQHADYVLLVADTMQTQRELLKKVTEHLHDIQANLIGVVLNRARPQRDRGYYYYGSLSEEPAGQPK